MLSRSKPLMFVVISMAAVILVGVTFLEAKKPKSWEWSVEIPGAEMGWNLYAYPAAGNSVGGVTFEDGGPIFVRVRKGKDPRDVSYSFRLWIDKDLQNKQKIGFEGLDLINNLDPGFEPTGKCPCSFPPNNPCPEVDPDEIPGCMQNFLVDNLHPYTDQAYDYKLFWLSVDVDCDIESMTSGETKKPSGNVHITVNKTDSPNPEGNEDHHSIVVGRDVVEGSIIEITRLDNNSWKIEVKDPIIEGDTGAMRFTEAYWGYWGKGKGRFETKKPIRAKAPFKFITTWTRN